MEKTKGSIRVVVMFLAVSLVGLLLSFGAATSTAAQDPQDISVESDQGI
ncbi:MAG TPA: hypothetical protein VLT82_06845 [Myxococcaceae bacterium]|nr:hypothetical protein [Myxococcaceae bacterium]